MGRPERLHLFWRAGHHVERGRSCRQLDQRSPAGRILEHGRAVRNRSHLQERWIEVAICGEVTSELEAVEGGAIDFLTNAEQATNTVESPVVGGRTETTGGDDYAGSSPHRIGKRFDDELVVIG